MWPSFWKAFPPKIKRIMTVAVFFFLAIIITAAGALTPLSREDASSINDELEQLRENVSVQYIFGNNFMLCLVMFVPIAGPVFGGYVLYNTGVVIAAESIANDMPPLIVLFTLLIFPFAWMEFLAYSTAFAESIWLTRRIMQRRGRKEIVNACTFIAICAVLLLVAAIIETALIESVTKPDNSLFLSYFLNI
jgi:uncharacterized membrane protein SpoIIM required for sporulation